ncbi:MAG TPA: YbhB/YbcL family Raf kinase inhibitor-like protein [Wenzhouxiangellaceae bacterium]|nr:YbhB/YbcL family Raf kinase inhibitor-like protein [Wenzhouxiangellaceae bacterium]
MRLDSRDITDHQPIAPRFAFGKPDPDDHMALSDNLSPHLVWSEVPERTKSLAVVCVDPDVPSEADDVNTEGKTLPADMPRVDFFHWVMVDVPSDLRELATGKCSDGVTEGGKQNPPGPAGARQGMNNYTQFLQGSELEGRYFGYDGPCPPWNDALLHRYRFTVYALDIEKLDLEDEFDGPAALKAMQGHVLDQATITGTYTLNPEVR